MTRCLPPGCVQARLLKKARRSLKSWKLLNGGATAESERKPKTETETNAMRGLKGAFGPPVSFASKKKKKGAKTKTKRSSSKKLQHEANPAVVVEGLSGKDQQPGTYHAAVSTKDRYDDFVFE